MVTTRCGRPRLGLALALSAFSMCSIPGGHGLVSAAAEGQHPASAAPRRISYGPELLQYGDLRLPHGPGPHPVVVVIHGGCWANFFGLELMDDMSDALTAAGVATWNIEYRRVGDPGGGYPNTLTDVGMAVDTVRALAKTYPLDLRRVITVGHSAGGHLGVWVGARHLFPRGHPLRGLDPLPLRAAVPLAGIMNLAAYLNLNLCGEFVDEFLGGTPAEVPERYALASPSALLPIGLDTTLVQGTRDTIVPLELAEHYREDAKDAGDHHVKLKKIRGADHFDVITPTSPKWPQVLERILEAVQESRETR